LIGDTLYGFSVKRAKELGLSRFYLHAAELGFQHPKTQQNMLFKAPWPEPDKKLLTSLGFSVE
jgi:23S rRNA pseudouridine1911/1915/1917 synthase